MTEVSEFSTTDASNTALGSINLTEGNTTIDQGNDIARALMGAVARQLGKVNVLSSSVASAATTDLSTASGWVVPITGTTTITSFGTETAGRMYMCYFAGILTLTYNATSLILPGGANITTAANDVVFMVSLGSGNWRCVAYTGAGAALQAGTLRLTSTGDVDLSSTTHAFQIGSSSAANMAIDSNEIQARNNGAAAGLALNTGGGDVTIGDSSSAINIPGTLTIG